MGEAFPALVMEETMTRAKFPEWKRLLSLDNKVWSYVKWRGNLHRMHTLIQDEKYHIVSIA